MVSVLVGFFTTFIGVFMVNDAKAISSGNSERGSAYNISMTPRYSKGEFYPLRDFEEPPEVDDFIGQTKVHST